MIQTEIHITCRQYEYRGEKDLGRWIPLTKVILRFRVDADEWENRNDEAMQKIYAALVAVSELGIKYEIIKIFKLKHQTVSFQHVYDAVNTKYFNTDN
jgi:hypothetical protein